MPSTHELLALVKLRRDLPPPSMRRALRERADLSKRQLAEALGVSAMAVCHWERGTRTPRGENLVRYAELLRVLQRELVP